MSTPHRDPASMLPLRPLIFAILVVLKKGDLHGYGIMKWVHENAGLSGILGPGTLYRTLKDMRASGVVARTETPPGMEDQDERRSYYTLTPLGHEVVVAEAERIGRMMGGTRLVEMISKADSR